MLAGVFAAPICNAEFAEVKQRGTLRVVVSSTTDPDFYTLTPDARPGLLREVLEGFAKLHKIGIEARVTAARQRAAELLAGRCDVVALTSNARDAPRMAFSDEVFPKRYVIVTRKPRSAVGSAEELRKETFGLSSSSNRAAALTALGVPFTRTATDAESLARIRAGSSTATIVSMENALAARDEDPLQIGFENVPTDSRCPTDVQCIWEGDATVRVWVQKAPRTRERLALHTSAREPRSATYQGYGIELLRLAPLPVSGRTIEQEDYEATLEVTRGSTRSSDSLSR